jgi:hypothetical protein
MERKYSHYIPLFSHSLPPYDAGGKEQLRRKTFEKFRKPFFRQNNEQVRDLEKNCRYRYS